MHIVGNSLNRRYPSELIGLANCDALEQINLAVAFVWEMNEVFSLAEERQVPLNLYALANGHGFPNIEVARKFIDGRRPAWRLFLTRDFFHPKLMWFRGVGVYIGSANLSNKAWVRNQECGIWVPQKELSDLGWDAELVSIFDSIHEHCREATPEDLSILQVLKGRRERLAEEEKRFQADIDRFLGHLPGSQPPIDVTKRRQSPGATPKAFRDDWDNGLAILNKIKNVFAEHKSEWPNWVDRDVAPAIVQDQATEWWWHIHFRKTGESRAMMVAAHEQNARAPDVAVRNLLSEWCRFEAERSSPWAIYMNESPRELRYLLEKEQLRALDQERLERILVLCHASREHGRQIRNEELGLSPEENLTIEQRIPLYADYLMRQRTAHGRSIRDVLEFVLWGDKRGTSVFGSVADRIWAAANTAEWKLRHLGVHIFGELIGTARPDDFPPRNNRVSKTLFALGFDRINYS